MNVYFEFLSVFLLIFALGCTLAYLPGVLKMRPLFKRNLIFLISTVLVCVLGNSIHTSYIWSLCFICLMFNIYSLLTDKRKNPRKILHAVVDYIVCSLIIFLSTCIVAMIDNIPIKHIILERFEDGSYTFTPGYLYEMITTSIIWALIVVNYKYIYFYLLHEWEERQNRKFTQLQSQKRNIETQFEALQAKVNPHFLYNSLNSIAGLATVDGEKTRQMALALSRFFRYSMNREQEVMTTLKEEAEMIRTYLEIEEIRFGKLLSYRIELPSEFESYKIPRMLLQPIVENCIKHGMKGNITELAIHISFSISDTSLILSVKDNGMTFPKDFIPGYGIQSVYEKLNLLYPHNYKVEINTEPEKDFRICLYQTKAPDEERG